MTDILVDVNEYKKATAPDELYSGGAGPCIVIGAIYEGTGYMLHDPSVFVDYTKFTEPIFADLRRDVKDKSKLKLYVFGAELDGDMDDEIMKGRQAVLDEIVKSGFQKAVKKLKWCPTGFTQSLRLNLSRGSAKIEETEDDF